MKGTKVTDPHSIPNWELSGFVEYITSGHKQGDMILVVPEGASAVRLGDEASIKTKPIKVTNGMFYSISFSAARTCAQEEKLNISFSPNKESKDWGILPIQTVYSSDGWDCYSWGFLAQSDEIAITIHNPGLEKDPACGPLIDNVALKALRAPTRQRGDTISYFENFYLVIKHFYPFIKKLLQQSIVKTHHVLFRIAQKVPCVFFISNKLEITATSPLIACR